jgi:hypothetical protein
MGEARRRREQATKQPEAQLSKQMTLPQRVLDEAAKGFDGFWKLADMVRANPALIERSDGSPWESWCYLPVNVVNGIVAHLLRDELTPYDVETRMVSVTRLLTATSAWRMTKSVYAFDPNVVAALAASEVDEDLPDELFLRLPDWCPYVSTPGLQVTEGLRIHGFFGYVDDRAYGNNKHFSPELNFEMLVDTHLSTDEAIVIPAFTSLELQNIVSRELKQGTLAEDSVRARFCELARAREYLSMHTNVPLGQGAFSKAFFEQSMHTAKTIPESLLGKTLDEANEKDLKWVTHVFGQMQARLGSLLLYLVSDKADVSPDTGQNDLRDRVVNNERRGIRNFQASQIRAWEVGYRIGAEIRAFENKVRESGEATGTGTSMRPHVRKAHWHSFWTGPRDQPQERRKRVRWLPPIPVNVTDSEDLVPTLHNVVNPPPQC